MNAQKYEKLIFKCSLIISICLISSPLIAKSKKTPSSKKFFSIKDFQKKLFKNNNYIESYKKKTFQVRRLDGDLKLNKNCNISDKSFKKIAFKNADKNRVPREIILGLLEVESSGNCFARRKELDGSESVGLFQLNTNTSKVPLCNKAQFQKLHNIKNENEFYGPNIYCLQNPIVNLQEAIKSLHTKYVRVNSSLPPRITQWDLLGKSGRDNWRKTLAAYNGGEAYLYQAFNDIDEVNRSYGLKLNFDDWEIRRLFMMRNMLHLNYQKKYFKNPIKFQRLNRLTYLNIVYVETIAGREKSSTQKSVANKWADRIYGMDNLQLSNNDKKSCWLCKERIASLGQ